MKEYENKNYNNDYEMTNYHDMAEGRKVSQLLLPRDVSGG